VLASALGIGRYIYLGYDHQDKSERCKHSSRSRYCALCFHHSLRHLGFPDIEGNLLQYHPNKSKSIAAASQPKSHSGNWLDCVWLPGRKWALDLESESPLESALGHHRGQQRIPDRPHQTGCTKYQ
jgi:hypothetical protein